MIKSDSVLKHNGEPFEAISKFFKLVIVDFFIKSIHEYCQHNS